MEKSLIEAAEKARQSLLTFRLTVVAIVLAVAVISISAYRFAPARSVIFTLIEALTAG